MKKAAIVCFLLFAPLAEGAGFKIVVNRANPASTLSSEDVAAMMMKKSVQWSDGTAVVAVDQVATSPVRAEFSDAVLRKKTDAVKSYWRQQIFSGRQTPPAEVRDDAEVLKYVRERPGAIGYVSVSAPTDGVKVVSLR